jgi:hypothetical protein
MHPRIIEELARQHQADLRRRVAGRDCRSPAGALRANAAPARTRRARTGPASTGLVGRGPAVSARASARHDRRTGDANRSLRARTGWWLVDLGLKLAVRPDSHRAASPRPAGS